MITADNNKLTIRIPGNMASRGLPCAGSWHRPNPVQFGQLAGLRINREGDYLTFLAAFAIRLLPN
ncbi:hypothetical protein D3C86_2019950 [compost metagenome]